MLNELENVGSYQMRQEYHIYNTKMSNYETGQNRIGKQNERQTKRGKQKNSSL